MKCRKGCMRGSHKCIQGERWGTLLAYALVCVDVALAVGASVRHILQVINQTWDQAAAEITTAKEGGGVINGHHMMAAISIHPSSWRLVQ